MDNDAQAPPPPALADALPLVADRLRGLSVDMSTARVEGMDYWTPDGWKWQWFVVVEARGIET
jgi:hypothetical protein